MPLVPQLDPYFFYVTMMTVEVVTSVVSAAFCLVTFASFFLLKSNKSSITPSHKLIIFLQINDLVRAVNTFAYAVGNRGDPRDCDGACKVVGFFTLWTNYNHGQIAMFICYLLYSQIVKRYKQGVEFNIYFVAGICNLISIIMSIAPAFSSSVFYFNYSWWVDIGCLHGWAAFIYLQVPVLICEAICIVTSVLTIKTIANIASSAPICTAENYKLDAIVKVSSLPLAFAITFLPSCIYHFVLFFGFLEFSSTPHYAFAPIMMFFTGIIGAVNSIIYLRNQGIGAKVIELYAQRKVSRSFSRGMSLASSGTSSTRSTLDPLVSSQNSPPATPEV